MTAAPRPDNEVSTKVATGRSATRRTGLRFAPMKALSVVGSLTLSVGGLMTLSSLIASPANAAPASCTAPTGSGLQQNLNTTQGCDVVDGTSLMSGYISDSGLAPDQQVTLEDAYEGLSSHLFYYGAYSLTLNCAPGSASPVTSNYVIAQGTGSYPLTPPTVSGTLPTVTADSSGNIVCAYSLTVTSAPSGHLNSSKSDLWIVAGGSGHTATTSVKPPVLGDPPVVTPSDPTTTAPSDPTTTAPSDPSTTAPSDPTTTAPSDPTTTAPSDPTTTAPSDPTTTAPSDPTTTAPSDPTTTAPSDPTTTAPSDPTTTAPSDPTTTAPVLQTATVADPSNAHTFVNNPTDVTSGDPGSNGSSSTTAPAGTSGPSSPTTFNPHGLSVLAFTGSMSEELAVIGLTLVLVGGLILGISRRRNGSRA